MQGDVSQIGGLVIYGGLKRKNQRETEIDSLMLFILCFFQSDYDLDFSRRCNFRVPSKSCQASSQLKTSD